MKRKIVGILVCMLVITTTIGTATSTNNETNIGKTSYTVDVPVWEIGDTWTYNARNKECRYFENGTLALTYYLNRTITFTVTATSYDNYTMKITSKNIEGSITSGSYRFRFSPFIKMNEEEIYRKSDIACVRSSVQLKGLVFWLLGRIGFPFPAQMNYAQGYGYTPAFVHFPFPLTAGTPDIRPAFSYTGFEKWSLYWGLISIIDQPQISGSSPEHTFNCEMTSITVPAGTYDAYNVSIDFSYGLGHHSIWRYYVPEVGWSAQLYLDSDWDSSGKPYRNSTMELVSTNYTP